MWPHLKETAGGKCPGCCANNGGVAMSSTHNRTLPAQSTVTLGAPTAQGHVCRPTSSGVGAVGNLLVVRPPAAPSCGVIGGIAHGPAPIPDLHVMPLSATIAEPTLAHRQAVFASAPLQLPNPESVASYRFPDRTSRLRPSSSAANCIGASISSRPDPLLDPFGTRAESTHRVGLCMPSSNRVEAMPSPPFMPLAQEQVANDWSHLGYRPSAMVGRDQVHISNRIKSLTHNGRVAQHFVAVNPRDAGSENQGPGHRSIFNDVHSHPQSFNLETIPTNMAGHGPEPATSISLGIGGAIMPWANHQGHRANATIEVAPGGLSDRLAYWSPAARVGTHQGVVSSVDPVLAGRPIASDPNPTTFQRSWQSLGPTRASPGALDHIGCIGALDDVRIAAAASGLDQFRRRGSLNVEQPEAAEATRAWTQDTDPGVSEPPQASELPEAPPASASPNRQFLVLTRELYAAVDHALRNPTHEATVLPPDGVSRKRWRRMLSYFTLHPENEPFRTLTWTGGCNLIVAPVEDWEAIVLEEMHGLHRPFSQHLSLTQTYKRLQQVYQTRVSRAGLTYANCREILQKCTCKAQLDPNLDLPPRI